MNELLGILFIFFLSVLLSIPLGKYISKVYRGEKTWLDFLNPLENVFYKIAKIDIKKEMTWQENLYVMLTINFLWFFWAFLLLITQDYHFWNPDNNPSMTPDLAFNTAISFLVNCNLQHYSGETGLSYLSQLACMTFLQFVTAGTGMACCALVFKAMEGNMSEKNGNFYYYFVRSCTRILLPISMVVAIILLFEGMPMTFEGKEQLITLQGDTVQVARGVTAAMIPIKQAGTNGGGYFGVNSAHPFENPTYFTNIIENVLITLIPMALIFALGHFVKARKFAFMVFGVMTVGFLFLLIPSVYFEMKGNPAIHEMGIQQNLGSMEGKEIRLGAGASAYWAITTTVTSNGSVNSMHDSATPITGLCAMLGMMVNAFYGGVGVGFLNFYLFIILTVFISGLMVGRTPEFMGKKVEAREIKIAVMATLLHPLLILVGTAIASSIASENPDIGWLNNPKFHGFSEMLYEFTSAAANNGSGFEGLGDNTLFWNISTGIVLLLSRYLPIIAPVAIAGMLAAKKSIPVSAGTLRTDTPIFGVMILAVIVIIAALSFFPALTLGSLAEYFTLYANF